MIKLNLIEISGMLIISIGVVFNLLGGIGILRFPNYFIRLHAATLITIGGSALPLIGNAILAIDALNFETAIAIALGSFATAIFLFLTAPVSTHAVARVAHRLGLSMEPKICDHLEEDRDDR